MSDSLNRRTFLGSVGLAAGAVSRPPFAQNLGASASPTPLGSADWDLTWVNALDRVPHKQVFDMGSLESGLHVPTNYLDAYQDVMKLKDGEVVAVVGIASSAFPMNASDALWAKHQLGEKWEIRDPATGAWAIRNIFDLDPAPMPFRSRDAVSGLARRGVIFWQCHNALVGVSERLSAGSGTAPAAMYQELRAGLLPHVRMVPAHTMLLGLVQERGATYEKL
jgi:hypothetical protein